MLVRGEILAHNMLEYEGNSRDEEWPPVQTVSTVLAWCGVIFL